MEKTLPKDLIVYIFQYLPCQTLQTLYQNPTIKKIIDDRKYVIQDAWEKSQPWYNPTECPECSLSRIRRLITSYYDGVVCDAGHAFRVCEYCTHKIVEYDMGGPWFVGYTTPLIIKLNKICAKCNK